MEQSLNATQEKQRLCHASLLAGAIGDSLGADIEFDSLDEILIKFPHGVNQLSRTSSRDKGWFTDDTQMTLWTAEGLIQADVSLSDQQARRRLIESVHEALLLWLKTQGGRPQISVKMQTPLIDDQRLWFRAAPGNTCLSSLIGAEELGARAQNNSKGCGTIMRVAPVALGLPSEMVWDVASETSALTHGHPAAYIAAAAWALILSDVFHGMSLDVAVQRALDRCRCEESDRHGRTVEASIVAALEAKRDGSPETVKTLGEGWVADEALAIALYAVLAAEGDFERGLQIAVTHTGDSDSTGAIAGNLLGLLYSNQIFAHRWSTEIGGADLIERCGELALSTR